jgi:hypothetical protein
MRWRERTGFRNVAKAGDPRKYEGARLGRQELNAEILDDVLGALWSRALIEETRWPVHRNMPDLVRIVVAIDPAASIGEDSDETGIIVAGKRWRFALEHRPGAALGHSEIQKSAIRRRPVWCCRMTYRGIRCRPRSMSPRWRRTVFPWKEVGFETPSTRAMSASLVPRLRGGDEHYRSARILTYPARWLLDPG